VTGFGKTDHVRTRIEIHFITCYNSHTRALSRHSDTIAIDKKVCFYRRLFADPIKPCRTITSPVGHWGALIRHDGMWSQAVPLDVCSPRGMVGFAVAICLVRCARGLVACVWGHRWPARPPPPPSPALPHPPLFVASMIFQVLLKTSLKISQSIQQLCKLV